MLLCLHGSNEDGFRKVGLARANLQALGLWAFSWSARNFLFSLHCFGGAKREHLQLYRKCWSTTRNLKSKS